MAMVQDKRKTPQDFWDSWVADFTMFADEIIKLHVAEERAEQLGLPPGEDVPFRMNPAQSALLQVTQRVEKWHEKAAPVVELGRMAQRHRIRVMVLKARQVGSSTFWVLWYLWRCLTVPGTRVAIVAQSSDSAKTILRIAGYAVQRLPAWLAAHPHLKAKVTTKTIVFANGSRISAGTANSEFWRGASLDGALLTEVTTYDNLKKTLSAVTRACAGPVVMESTAQGMGLFKDIWDDTRGSWEKVFISWMADPFCRLEHTNVQPTAEDLEYIARWKLDEQQKNWFLETKWTEFAGDQQQFDQECPASPELAFIVAGSKFFRGRHFQYDPRDMPVGELHCWEAYQQGHKYAIGVDVAQGAEEGDASTAVVLDVTDLKDIRVAAVMQCWQPTPVFGEMVVKLARDYRNVLVCVERNIGLDVIRTLRHAGIRQYVRQVEAKMTEQVDEHGFMTTAQTRPMLMANLTRYVMGNSIKDLRDPRLKDECNNFAYNARGKPEAVKGKHDDLVMGLALALENLSQYNRMSEPLPQPKVPPRPSHDLAAALQWDRTYGYRPPKASPY
jgi:hypothetical protein